MKVHKKSTQLTKEGKEKVVPNTESTQYYPFIESVRNIQDGYMCVKLSKTKKERFEPKRNVSVSKIDDLLDE